MGDIVDKLRGVPNGTAAEAADEIERLRAEAPCKWVGGNDCMTCMVCGADYDWRRQGRPSCGAEAQIEGLKKQRDTAFLAGVKAGLEAAAQRFDEIAQHDQSGIDYSDAVGIAISNRAELQKSVRHAEMDAAAIRAIDPITIKRGRGGCLTIPATSSGGVGSRGYPPG